MQILRPAAAAMGEVVAMGHQPLMQMAGQLGDAVGPWVMPEEVAGHADLPAAGFHQGALIEVRPLFDRGFESGGQGRWPGERDAHEPLQMRTPVLARVRAVGCRSPMG